MIKLFMLLIYGLKLIKCFKLISLAEDLLLKGHAEHVPGEHTKLETLESICT